MRALLGMDGVVFDGEGLGLPLRIVGNDQLDRMQDGHRALCGIVQILAQAVFQKRVLNRVRSLRHADALTKSRMEWLV